MCAGCGCWAGCGVRRARMVRGVQRVLMLPVMLLRAARCGVCRVLLRAARCMPGAAGVRPGQADWKN